MSDQLLAAARVALKEMCQTVAPRQSFTEAVDTLDAAIMEADKPPAARSGSGVPDVEGIIARGRRAIDTLRDATREGRIINVRQRDPLVLDLHAVLDAVVDLHAALAQSEQERDEAQLKLSMTAHARDLNQQRARDLEAELARVTRQRDALQGALETLQARESAP